MISCKHTCHTSREHEKDHQTRQLSSMSITYVLVYLKTLKEQQQTVLYIKMCVARGWGTFQRDKPRIKRLYLSTSCLLAAMSSYILKFTASNGLPSTSLLRKLTIQLIGRYFEYLQNGEMSCCVIFLVFLFSGFLKTKTVCYRYDTPNIQLYESFKLFLCPVY